MFWMSNVAVVMAIGVGVDVVVVGVVVVTSKTSRGAVHVLRRLDRTLCQPDGRI